MPFTGRTSRRSPDRDGLRTPAPPSLLEQVRGLIERTYDHRTGLGPLAPFLVGDEGYRRVVAGRHVVRRVGHAGAEAQLLVRTGADGRVRVSLYFPDRLIRELERHPPSRDLHRANVDAFAAFVEEIDHLLLLASRAPGGPALTLLEMEIHANVTKDLVLRHFLARLGGLRRLPAEAVAWVRYHLFHKPRYADPDPTVRRRYEEAARFAVRYLRRLDRLPAARRIADLRRFSRMSHHQKLGLLGACA